MNINYKDYVAYDLLLSVRDELNNRFMFRPEKEIKEMIVLCRNNTMHKAAEILIYQYDVISSLQSQRLQFANKIFRMVEKYDTLNKLNN